MESAVFHLNSDELDARFIESVKSFFKSRRIKVTVTTEETHPVTDTELLEAVKRNEKAEFAYTISGDDFDALADKFIENNDFDVISAIKEYKMAL